MPIVTITASTTVDAKALATMIANIRAKGAEALLCSVDNIWVHFQQAELGHYIQTEKKLASPYVIIRAQAGRPKTTRELFVKAVANAIGEGLSISPKEVWIHYQEMNPADIWTEGHWAS